MWHTGRDLLAVLVCVLCVITWVVTPLIYEFAKYEYIPVTLDKEGRIVLHPYGVFTLGLGGKYSNLPRGDISPWRLPTVSLLTDNPKVRTLDHHVSVRVTNAQVFYGADPSRISMNERSGGPTTTTTENCIDRNVELVLQRIFYDLNNTHSKDLAQFFNPLDATQQDSYRKLMEEYLNPLLAQNGLVVTKATFGISQ
ncbi:MAG: hypothetical protein AAB365_02510 [Patescibacteria group bacterium]